MSWWMAIPAGLLSALWCRRGVQAYLRRTPGPSPSPPMAPAEIQERRRDLQRRLDCY